VSASTTGAADRVATAEAELPRADPREAISQLARRCVELGAWGARTSAGTLNFITPERVRRAAACVKRGVVFQPGTAVGADGPQIGQGGRVNPLHIMTATKRLSAAADGPRYADDASSCRSNARRSGTVGRTSTTRSAYKRVPHRT